MNGWLLQNLSGVLEWRNQYNRQNSTPWGPGLNTPALYHAKMINVFYRHLIAKWNETPDESLNVGAEELCIY